MKFFGAAALLAAATGAWAGDAGRAPNRAVTTCLSPGGNAAILFQGREVATRVLKQAGIRLEWRNDEHSCVAAGRGIVIEVSFATPKDRPSDALAYAMPFERTHVVLFYDRVLSSAAPAMVPYLLGHVLAHEIVHMLQGTDRHSASGVMKAHWDNHDYTEMLNWRLHFTEEDILLIQGGLARPPRPAPVD